MDFYDSYHYLEEHPIFKNHFQYCLDIEIVKVNPITNSVDDDFNKNTKTQIWLECGPYKSNYATHDVDLDCGGDTFEEAIIELASLVKDVYGDDLRKAIQKVQDKYGFDVL